MVLLPRDDMGPWPPRLAPRFHPRKQQGPGPPSHTQGAQGPAPGSGQLGDGPAAGRTHLWFQGPFPGAAAQACPGTRCFSAQGLMIRKGMARQAVIGGPGNIMRVLQADPIPPPESHAMSFLWAVLGFLLFGGSSGKHNKAQGARQPHTRPLPPPTPTPPEAGTWRAKS